MSISAARLGSVAEVLVRLEMIENAQLEAVANLRGELGSDTVGGVVSGGVHSYLIYYAA